MFSMWNRNTNTCHLILEGQGEKKTAKWILLSILGEPTLSIRQHMKMFCAETLPASHFDKLLFLLLILTCQK